jgi:hypothetical protein
LAELSGAPSPLAGGVAVGATKLGVAEGGVAAELGLSEEIAVIWLAFPID